MFSPKHTQGNEQNRRYRGVHRKCQCARSKHEEGACSKDRAREYAEPSRRPASRHKPDGHDRPNRFALYDRDRRSVGLSRVLELDLDRLVEYSQRLGNRAAMRRLGFWLERLEIGHEGLLQRLEAPDDRNYALLDPRGPKEGERDARWRLIVNVPEHQLLEWREH